MSAGIFQDYDSESSNPALLKHFASQEDAKRTAELLAAKARPALAIFGVYEHDGRYVFLMSGRPTALILYARRWNVEMCGYGVVSTHRGHIRMTKTVMRTLMQWPMLTDLLEYTLMQLGRLQELGGDLDAAAELIDQLFSHEPEDADDFELLLSIGDALTKLNAALDSAIAEKEVEHQARKEAMRALFDGMPPELQAMLADLNTMLGQHGFQIANASRLDKDALEEMFRNLEVQAPGAPDDEQAFKDAMREARGDALDAFAGFINELDLTGIEPDDDESDDTTSDSSH